MIRSYIGYWELLPILVKMLSYHAVLLVEKHYGL